MSFSPTESLTFPVLLRCRLEPWSLKAITNQFLKQSPSSVGEAMTGSREAAFSKWGEMWLWSQLSLGLKPESVTYWLCLSLYLWNGTMNDINRAGLLWESDNGGAAPGTAWAWEMWKSACRSKCVATNPVSSLPMNAPAPQWSRSSSSYVYTLWYVLSFCGRVSAIQSAGQNEPSWTHSMANLAVPGVAHLTICKYLSLES